jgi:hypothetical protein
MRRRVKCISHVGVQKTGGFYNRQEENGLVNCGLTGRRCQGVAPESLKLGGFFEQQNFRDIITEII